MPTAKPSHEEIIVEIDIRVSNIIEESVRYLSPRWKHLLQILVSAHYVKSKSLLLPLNNASKVSNNIQYH